MSCLGQPVRVVDHNAAICATHGEWLAPSRGSARRVPRRAHRARQRSRGSRPRLGRSAAARPDRGRTIQRAAEHGVDTAMQALPTVCRHPPANELTGHAGLRQLRRGHDAALLLQQVEQRRVGWYIEPRHLATVTASACPWRLPLRNCGKLRRSRAVDSVTATPAGTGGHRPRRRGRSPGSGPTARFAV